MLLNTFILNSLFGLKIFKQVWFQFSFVSDYDNKFKKMKNKNQTDLKKDEFKPHHTQEYHMILTSLNIAT